MTRTRRWGLSLATLVTITLSAAACGSKTDPITTSDTQNSICMAFAGCSTFEDGTADNHPREIVFANFEYQPKCLKIKAGQTVTFKGGQSGDDFNFHPIKTACGPDSQITLTSSDKSKSFTLSKTGVYGFFCVNHGTPQGDAMAGAIMVE